MEIQNRDIKNAIIATTGINPSSQDIPSTLAKVISPVIDVNPLHNKITNIMKSSTLSNATTNTIFTTDTQRDTYLTAAEASYIKDATSTATNLTISCTSDETNASFDIIRFAGLTLTANSGNVAISLPNPIKLKRGSNVTLTSDTNVANILMKACVFGFTIDNF